MVLCPKVVRSVWADECEKWAYPFKTLVLEGTTRQRQAALEFLSAPALVVLNYESAVRMPDALLSHDWDIIVLDESHRSKGTSSKISRLCFRLAQRTPRRLLLSGTPADKPIDWFAQARVVDEGIFGRTVKGFHRRYCEFGNPFTPQQITAYRNQREMQERLARHVMHIESRDVLDLPGETDSIIRVQMSTEGRRKYDALEREFAVELDGSELTADGILPKLLRLSQMTGGVVEAEGVAHRVDEMKEAALTDWLRDVREPVVVVCRFHSDLDAVRRAAGDSAELSGRVNELDAWQAGRARVLAMQITAGNVGISLVRARHMVFYSTGYSLIDMEQARGRVLRPGQAMPVQYTHLVMADTIDEAIAQAHIGKSDVVAAVKAGITGRHR